MLTIAAHGERALVAGARWKPAAVILAPVFATASHPDTPCLGPLRCARLTRNVATPVIALGGMTSQSTARLAGSGVAGVAAIGALV